MSTRIGIIAEGPIDHCLLPPLLGRIARERADYGWPLTSEDVAEVFSIRKRGHGGVLETVRRLVKALDAIDDQRAFYVILLDRRTKAVQEEIKKLLENRDRFVLGIAIEEIEAWWLGDRTNTLAWAGLKANLPAGCRHAKVKYQSERDDAPKKTLDELTQISDRFDRCYGEGNKDLAQEFADDYAGSPTPPLNLAGGLPAIIQAVRQRGILLCGEMPAERPLPLDRALRERWCYGAYFALRADYAGEALATARRWWSTMLDAGRIASDEPMLALAADERDWPMWTYLQWQEVIQSGMRSLATP